MPAVPQRTLDGEGHGEDPQRVRDTGGARGAVRWLPRSQAPLTEEAPAALARRNRRLLRVLRAERDLQRDFHQNRPDTTTPPGPPETLSETAPGASFTRPWSSSGTATPNAEPSRAPVLTSVR
jgi:hypothetical protein